MPEYLAEDVIEDWQLGYNLGTALYLIKRRGLTDSDLKFGFISDLKRAVWHINREIERITNDEEDSGEV